MKILMLIKKIINSYGYDVKKYRPLFKETIKPFNIKTVLDIGANNGHYAKNIRHILPTARIYSFEPLADCYQQLTTTMATDPNFEAFNVALGDTDQETTINLSSFHPSSSILPMGELHKKLYPKSKDSTPQKIKIKKLDDILPVEKLIDDILIKIDVQGFEDKVITGGENVIKKAKVVIVETSFVTLYESQPLFDDIYHQMKNLNFSYFGSLERHYDPHSGQLIYEDSIFIKQ